MKSKIKQKFPPGWTEKRVRALAEYYDNQTDEEGAAEMESASKPTKLCCWSRMPWSKPSAG